MKCKESFVYLDKIFDTDQGGSCPIMVDFDSNPNDFSQRLVIDDNDCCGCSQTIPTGAQFQVTDVKVEALEFDLTNPESLAAAQVTVNGRAVDDIHAFNQRYVVSTGNLMENIADCRCLRSGASVDAYLLITDAGSWSTRLSITVKGTMSGCSDCRCFTLCLTNLPGRTVGIDDLSTFAVPSLKLPCTKNGIAPLIGFSFDATAMLLNPTLVRVGEDSNCTLRLCGQLIVTPSVDVEVTRSTLFRTNDLQVAIPCDNADSCETCCDSCHCDGESGREGNENGGNCAENGRNSRAGSSSNGFCCQFNGRNGMMF